MLKSDLAKDVILWTITELEKSSKILGDHLHNCFLRTGFSGKNTITSANYLSDLLSPKVFLKDEITESIEDIYYLTESEDKKSFTGHRISANFCLNLIETDGKGYTSCLMRDEILEAVNLILEIKDHEIKLEAVLKPMTSKASESKMSYKNVLVKK